MVDRRTLGRDGFAGCISFGEFGLILPAQEEPCGATASHQHNGDGDEDEYQRLARLLTRPGRLGTA